MAKLGVYNLHDLADAPGVVKVRSRGRVIPSGGRITIEVTLHDGTVRTAEGPEANLSSLVASLMPLLLPGQPEPKRPTLQGDFDQALRDFIKECGGAGAAPKG
jgi:hypothetical protein